MKRPSFQTWFLATLSAMFPSWQILKADTVPEAEANGAAVNNTLATAQLIGPGAFTAAGSPAIFGSTTTASVLGRNGGDDVDFFAFDVAGPVHAYFDVDAPPGAFDSYLALFGSDGTVLAANDDSFPGDPGSASDLDAFVGVYTLPAAGRYYIAVSAAPNVPVAAFSGTDFPELVRPDGEFGGNAFVGADPGISDYFASGPQLGAGYTLHISVPAPGAAAVLGVGGLLASRRRRAG